MTKFECYVFVCKKTGKIATYSGMVDTPDKAWNTGDIYGSPIDMGNRDAIPGWFKDKFHAKDFECKKAIIRVSGVLADEIDPED